MFTGIIESLGKVRKIEREGTNIHFTLESPVSHELKVDQSLSHDGVCLTVVAVENNRHTVTAVQETLNRTRLEAWTIGTEVNLERCLPLGGRLDGHIVQGHVDDVAECISVEDQNGSWLFGFRYRPTREHLLVDKGSVCINGVSLTVVDPRNDLFYVSVIPYTFENTNFKYLRPGHRVNVEFDIIGKYVAAISRFNDASTTRHA